MEYFEALADRVEELAGSQCLSDAAYHALTEMPPKDAVRDADIAAWVARGRIPKQVDLLSDFGDYALTAAHRSGFHIQLLFWKDACTAIHDHGFSGAFTVLSGSSVHVTYGFAIDDATTPHFILGRLHAKSTELLREGDVRRIESGPSFIHGVFHLDRPTISLVIRTFRDDLPRPSLGYKPTLGIDHFREKPESIRKLQYLDLALECYPSQANQVLRDLLTSADLSESYALLESMLARGETVASLAPSLRLVQERHGELASGFVEALAFVRRNNNILERRKILTRAEHRLLLALLLTAPDRPTLLGLVASLTDQEPIKTICTWLREMSQMSVAPQWGPNAIGVDLSETSLRFLAASLAGADVDAAAARASTDPKDQALLALTLPRASILKPLFTL